MAKLHPIDIVCLMDKSRGLSLIEGLRKKIGKDIIPSRKEIDQVKNQLCYEFNALLKPTKTDTGWRIDPMKLHKLLCLRYPWLPEKGQFWRLYGDGRNIGDKPSVVVTFNNVNHELYLHDIKYHSVHNIWPLAIFSGHEGRYELESNLAFIDGFVAQLQREGHIVYMTGDSKFFDSVLAETGLGPLTNDGFNHYIHMDKDSLMDTHPDTGRRTDLLLHIDREHRDSILPSIPLGRFVFDPMHGITRIVEKILKEAVNTMCRVSSLLVATDLISLHRRTCMDNLNTNIRLRNVKSGNLCLELDSKGKLNEFTLNNTDAVVLIAPADQFNNNKITPIFYKVLPDKKDIELNEMQQDLLQLNKNISYYDLFSELIKHAHTMYGILLTDNCTLISDENRYSKDSSHYFFGIPENLQQQYLHHAECFYQLYHVGMNARTMSGYMSKFIDVAPLQLKQLKEDGVNSYQRLQCQGTEALHYFHQSFFYQCTPRGGGVNHNCTMLMTLQMHYRLLRQQFMEMTSDSELSHYGHAFLKYASEALHQNAQIIQQAWRCKLIRMKHPHLCMIHTLPHPSSRRQLDFGQGATQAENDVCEMNSSVDILPVDDIQNSVPVADNEVISSNKALLGQNFIIVGKIPAYIKLNRDTFLSLIKRVGGRVLQRVPARTCNMKVTILTTQNEINRKVTPSVVVKGIRNGWDVLNCQYILDIEQQQSVDKSSYKLDISGILAKCVTVTPPGPKQR